MIRILAIACSLLLLLPSLVLFARVRPNHLAAAYGDPARLLELMSTSLMVCLGTAGLALLLGVPAAFAALRCALPGRRLLIGLALAGACLPLYVTASAWLSIAGPPFWSNSVLGVIWIQGLGYAPLAFLVAGYHFHFHDPNIEDAALLETGTWGVFRHLVLGTHAGGILAAGCTVAVLSLTDITVTDLLMVRTFSEEVFTQYQLGGGPERAAATALPVVLAILLLCFALRRLIGRGSRRESEAREGRLLSLGTAGFPLAIVVWGLALAVPGIPGKFLAEKVQHPRNLWTAWQAASDELVGTLWMTALAVLVIVPLALLLAESLRRGQAVKWISGSLLLLVAVPGPVSGAGLILLFNRPGLAGAIYDSPLMVVFAYLLRALPFAVLVLLPALRAIPRELDESAQLEGAGAWSHFRLVLWPWIGPALKLCALVSAVLCLGEIGGSFLVVPPGHGTLSIRFFTLIHYGVYPDAAGICVLLLVLLSGCALGLGLSARGLKGLSTLRNPPGRSDS